MKRSLITCVLLSSILWLDGQVLAGRVQTLSLEPDPGCRRSKLVLPVEQVLRDTLSAPGLKVLDKGADKGRLLLQYFLMEHPQGDSVQVQLDGQIYGRARGKLWAEGNARSDAFDADEAGRRQAADQAAQRLAEQLNGQLEAAMATTGKGRRIMLQVELAQGVMDLREELLGKMKSSLKAFRPVVQGSTARNLVFTLYSSERSKALAERIDEALEGLQGIKCVWIVKSRSTLMLRIDR